MLSDSVSHFIGRDHSVGQSVGRSVGYICRLSISLNKSDTKLISLSKKGEEELSIRVGKRVKKLKYNIISIMLSPQ